MKTSDDFGLRRDLRHLRNDRSPEHDLWPGIRARLPSRQPTRSGVLGWRWAGALAACAVLAAAATISFRMTRAVPERSVALSDVGSDDMAHADAADTLLMAYSEILAVEGSRFSGVPRHLSAPGEAERMAAARELDASLAGLANALRVEPESQLLRRLMHQTLQQRLALTLDMPVV